MISFPEGAAGGLRIVTRDRDLRSEQQKTFDLLREEAMAEANADYAAKQTGLARQSEAAKAHITTAGFVNFAVDLQAISDLMGVFGRMRSEYPDLSSVISQVEDAASQNPPDSAQGLRDLFAEIIRRDEDLSSAQLQQAQKMMQRMDELLMMPDGLLELLDERQKTQKA